MISGEPTLEPEDMYDPKPKPWLIKNPWNAPGSALIFGEGCGANGGNPKGHECNLHEGGMKYTFT